MNSPPHEAKRCSHYIYIYIAPSSLPVITRQQQTPASLYLFLALNSPPLQHVSITQTCKARASIRFVTSSSIIMLRFRESEELLFADV